MKATGTDPKASGLVIVEIPLDVRPDSDWADCFFNPTTSSVSVHPPRIFGDMIELRATKDRPEKDLEWVYKYIEQANECYRKKMEEKERERQRRAKIEAEGAEELRDLTEKLRQV